MPSKKSAIEKVNASEFASAQRAIAKGDALMLSGLIARGLSLRRRSRGRTLLMLAAQSGELACARLLAPLSDPLEIDARGKSALAHAVEGAKPAVVRLLLGRVPFDLADEQGMLPLHYAVIKGSAPIARLLAPLGGLDARESRGLTPWMLAARLGQEKLLTVLLGCDAMGAQAINRAARGMEVKELAAGALDPLLAALALRAGLSESLGRGERRSRPGL